MQKRRLCDAKMLRSYDGGETASSYQCFWIVMLLGEFLTGMVSGYRDGRLLNIYTPHTGITRPDARH
jgi:hypothetical protein